jgi:hypothetical protein
MSPVGILAAAIVAAGPGIAQAAGGDPNGVSLARAVRIALARVPAETYEQTGFAYIRSEQLPAPVFRWRWGGGPVAGLVPAREQATVGLKEGRVTWWRDDLTPLPCAEAALCGEVTSVQVPVELLVVPAGAFYSYGSRTSHGCYGRLAGSTPLRIGDRTWTLFGEFDLPAAHGTTQLLKSRFPWGLTAGSASETASVSMHTHLPIREQTQISPAPGGGAPFAFAASFGYPARARAPKVTLCGSGQSTAPLPQGPSAPRRWKA